jgi:hypothetical protein
MTDEQEIRCPLCEWQPQPEDRWSCAPGCGTVWNTFWTRGLCPGCSQQWSVTQCLACKGVSLHRKWYRTPAGGRTRRERATEPA